MNTVIKRVTVNDVSELCEISRETFKDTFGADNTSENMKDYLDNAYSKNQLISEINTSGTTFWFLMSDDKVVGYLKLNIDQAQSDSVAPGSLEVERIYILKEYKRHGFGSTLIKYAFEVAAKSNRSKIWLGVWEHNEAAKGFYKKMGFKQIRDHVFQLGNDKQRDLILLKQLDK
ncbi:GNAT family N-acetyltransferase [Companilactobacillus allii]|uniref:GNAT family N-acetyltransferase n=1 Tax=Companilactobacillus allii TaxID=1847728 RepID=A0A1P8Q4I2_9LACO|nr:GNAT family N-acetyltransferase [Companilactobacillus allii]APX72733.1 GNAT family N-acetyltransferase [Companilactobacillus allii]USQ67518.1 GNAT family N-acetyltransferase [Companilactobacillus allii]